MVTMVRRRASRWPRHIIVGALVVTGSAWADVGTLLENCAACHGKDGASTESDVPIIGGYSAKYLGDSLTNYLSRN